MRQRNECLANNYSSNKAFTDKVIKTGVSVVVTTSKIDEFIVIEQDTACIMMLHAHTMSIGIFDFWQILSIL
jgi:hypothetical protein